MSMGIDVFLKPGQLPSDHLLPMRMSRGSGMICDVDVDWGKSEGRVPAKVKGHETGFELYAARLSKSDVADDEIPAAAVRAGRTYRIHLVWRRPLEGAAAYAFAAAVGKMKDGTIIDGQTNLLIKPADASAVARSLYKQYADEARKAAPAKPEKSPALSVKRAFGPAFGPGSRADVERCLRRRVQPMLGDEWAVHGLHLIRRPVGPVMCGGETISDLPKIEVTGYVPRAAISTTDVGVRDAIFSAKVARGAAEEAVARALAALMKARLGKWCDRVATPARVAERLKKSGDDLEFIGGELAASLILAGRYDEAAKPLQAVIDYHDPRVHKAAEDRAIQKQRLELRAALDADPELARELLRRRARETAKRIGVAKWCRTGDA